MHKVYVPLGSEKSQSWQGVLNDLHRGRVVGTPDEVEWHPHSATQPCTEECMLVIVDDSPDGHRMEPLL